MVFIAIVLWFVLLLVGYLYWHVKVSDPRQPPLYPGILPFIGHTNLLSIDTSKFWDLYRTISHHSLDKGGATSIYVFWLKICFLTDPHDCLKVANTFFNKGYVYDFAKFTLQDGLLTSDAETWKRHLKLINPTFSLRMLDDFLKIFNKQSRKLVDELSIEIGKKPFDHLEYLARNFLETVCQTVLGLNDDLDESLKQEYLTLVKETEHMTVERFLTPWMHVPALFEMSQLRRKHGKVIKQLQNISNQILQKRKLEIKKREQSGIPTEGVRLKAFLDLVLESNAMTDTEIQNQVDTLIITGYESTSSTLMFFFLLLGAHPKVEDCIREELEEVFQSHDRDVEKQDLTKLVYMDAVIKETLRIYSVLPMIARQIDEDIKLDKWTLTKGTCCVFSIYGLHRHPAWGPDVNQFRPERWLDQTTPDTSLYFTPFGLGRRNCVGKTYAMMIMKTAAVHLLRRYKFSGDVKNLKVKYEIALKPASGHEISVNLC